MLHKFNVTNSSSRGFPQTAPKGALLGAKEVITSLTTAGAGALTGAILATNILNRTGPVGDVNDTTDAASDIIAAIPGCESGDTFRLRYINTVAHTITVVAGTGVTVTNGAVNPSSVKDFLVSVDCAAPAVVVPSAVLVNATKVITGIADTSALRIGMLVTGTSAGASAKVVGIQPGVGVTVDVNSTGSTTNSLTFSPAVTITGLGQGLL